MNTYYAYYSGALCNQARPSRTRLQMANSVYTALKPLEIRQVFPAAFALSKSAFAYLKLLRTHKRWNFEVFLPKMRQLYRNITTKTRRKAPKWRVYGRVRLGLAWLRAHT